MAGHSPAVRSRAQRRLGEQSRFVKTLSRLAASAQQRRAPVLSDDEASSDILVDITATSELLRSHPVPQGPYLLQPAPRLLQGSLETDACDIAVIDFSPPSTSSVTDAGLSLMLIASSDGRVDVCLLVEHVEPVWSRSRVRIE